MTVLSLLSSFSLCFPQAMRSAARWPHPKPASSKRLCLPWPGSSVVQNIIPVRQSCRFNPRGYKNEPMRCFSFPLSSPLKKKKINKESVSESFFLSLSPIPLPYQLTQSMYIVQTNCSCPSGVFHEPCRTALHMPPLVSFFICSTFLVSAALSYSLDSESWMILSVIRGGL